MRSCLFFILCTLFISPAGAQVTLSGSIQSDILVPETDEAIGAEKTDDVLTNTYVDLLMQSKYVDAGGRFEYLDHPLPGFEQDFAGWGVRHYWVKGKLNRDGRSAELTLGSLYEQFGSGFILRTYEDRPLGIDNSLMGGRIVLNLFPGISFKALSGTQRRYWHYNKGQVSGADLELSVDEWFKGMQEAGTHLTLGASWVNKYEATEDLWRDATHRYVLPEYVNAFDLRATVNHGPWSLLAEYAHKSQDPSADNDYIYRDGSVAMLSGSYSTRGLSLLLQAKRSENMAFRSRRSMRLTSSFINHLPAFTLDHTYALAALYPYATQYAPGEWAYQGELSYNFKRRTALGGKYGMNVKLNYSYVRALNISNIADDAPDVTDGYTSSFFKWGADTYYQDLDIQLSRKLTKDFKLNLMYMNQRYNKDVVEGHGGMIHSDIFVADAKYQFTPTTILRCEAQYLSTDDDQGDWVYGLLELSLARHWMLTLSDMYNSGHNNPQYYTDDSHHHYYQGLVTYSGHGHRIQLGYGRTRAGYNCSGGVCRWIPASRGVTLSYNYNF